MNKLMLAYLGVDFLFLLCGGLLLGFCLINQQQERTMPTTSNTPYNVLLAQQPLTAGVVNAIVIFVIFLVSLPALAMPMNKGWLKLQGFLIIVCSFFTLVLGLVIWFTTLETRKNLSHVWGTQSPEVQSLLQQRFNCCGYTNSMEPPFITDNTCPNSLLASQKVGCVGPFSSFANVWLNLVFTAAFGIVGVDFLLGLCVVMVIKHRYELERYRHIDEKLGIRF